MATTWPCDGTPTGNNFAGGSVQWVHDNQAVNGDTIAMPNGTFTWTVRINLIKAVTLQGNAIVNYDNGAGGYTVTPNTTIVDNVTDRNSMIWFKGSGGQRLTGIAFEPNSIPQAQMALGGIQVVTGCLSGIRVDHCFFHNLNWQTGILYLAEYNYGVFDHNVHDNRGLGDFGCGIVLCYPGQVDYGDIRFTEPAGWGGPNFFFVENNWASQGTDIMYGGKLCLRYNHFHGEFQTTYGALTVCHGTGRQVNARGGRAYEIYNNDFHWNQSGKSQDGNDSGTALWHDNTFSNNGLTIGNINTAIFREGHDFLCPFFGTNALNNNWDVMDTDGNGNNVPGQPAHVFASGTTTAGTAGGVINDTSKSWAPNQWLGYVIRRTATDNSRGTGGINSSTPTQYNVTQTGYGDAWAPGQPYEIVRCLIALDQPGRGAGDQFATVIHNLVGSVNFPAATVTLDSVAGIPTTGTMMLNGHENQFVFYNGIVGNTLQNCTGGSITYSGNVSFRKNTVTGGPDWAHQALEPQYCWNTINTDTGLPMKIAVSQDCFKTTLVEGRDIINGTPLAGYTPYVYPHPLVSGGSTGKIISLSGTGLAFGNVTIGNAPTGTLMVSNTGDTVLTVSSISYPAGFSGATTGFVVAPSGTQNVTVTFTPLLAQVYSGNIIVTSDATSGTNTIAVSGTGVPPLGPPPTHKKRARDAYATGM